MLPPLACYHTLRLPADRDDASRRTSSHSLIKSDLLALQSAPQLHLSTHSWSCSPTRVPLFHLTSYLLCQGCSLAPPTLTVMKHAGRGHQDGGRCLCAWLGTGSQAFLRDQHLPNPSDRRTHQQPTYGDQLAHWAVQNASRNHRPLPQPDPWHPDAADQWHFNSFERVAHHVGRPGGQWGDAIAPLLTRQPSWREKPLTTRSSKRKSWPGVAFHPQKWLHSWIAGPTLQSKSHLQEHRKRTGSILQPGGNVQRAAHWSR